MAGSHLRFFHEYMYISFWIVYLCVVEQLFLKQSFLSKCMLKDHLTLLKYKLHVQFFLLVSLLCKMLLLKKKIFVFLFATVWWWKISAQNMGL